METNDIKKERTIHPILWIGLSGIILMVDYLLGPFVQFPVTYLIPVALASWYNGRWWGLGFSILLPLIRFYFNIALWVIPWTIVEATINTIIRIIVLSSFAVTIDLIAKQTRELSKEVQLLKGLLPICSFCKKIRDEKNQWQTFEKYITDRSTAMFTHGICPECAEKYYGDLYKKK